MVSLRGMGEEGVSRRRIVHSAGMRNLFVSGELDLEKEQEKRS